MFLMYVYSNINGLKCVYRQDNEGLVAQEIACHILTGTIAIGQINQVTYTF